MKKLMIIAAVALAAFASNASVVKWSVTNLIGTDGNKAGNTYAIQLVCVSDTTESFKAGDVVASGNITAMGAKAAAVLIDTGSNLGTMVLSAVATAPTGETLDMGEKTLKLENAGSTYTAAWNVNNAASDWKAVPEPTSGMLLLLGVAGLALRRRRA